MHYTWSKYTVLIAEDDPISFKYLQLLLEKRTGIQILWAKDGKKACEMVMNAPEIDLVLLDLQLPEMNGLQVLQKIKKFNPSLPVIIQTANSWNNEEDSCVKAGCEGFFTKPLNVDLLFDSMEKFLLAYVQQKSLQQLAN
jgi:CheY-like chemotaxis protein